jgi:MFS family permease
MNQITCDKNQKSAHVGHVSEGFSFRLTGVAPWIYPKLSSKFETRRACGKLYGSFRESSMVSLMEDERSADQRAVIAPASPVLENERLPRGIYNNFIFEFSNAIMWQSFGSPVVLFIRQCGASAFIVGSLSAIPLLLMPLTLAAARLVEKWGYRRTALTVWTARWVFSASLIAVALLDFPGFGAWRIPLILLVIFLFHLMRNFGISANIPWITAIVPQSRRGLYLSRTTLFANLGSIAAFLTIGVILGNNPPLAQFAPVFILGALGGLGSTIFMARIQPPPKVKTITAQRRVNRQHLSFWAEVKKCFAMPGFKAFVVIQTFYGVAFIGIPSLSLIYLREKVGISPNVIIYFSMAGVVGATLTALVWGRWIDRHGTDSLQLVAFAGMSLNSVLWVCIGLLGSNEANIALAALVNFLSAVWIAALNMSQTHTIMALAPEDNRVMFQNIATLMTQLSQALAPMLWGILLDWLDHAHFTMIVGGMEIGPYRFFFLASLGLGLIGVIFLGRLTRQARRIRLVEKNA